MHSLKDISTAVENKIVTLRELSAATRGAASVATVHRALSEKGDISHSRATAIIHAFDSILQGDPRKKAMFEAVRSVAA